MQIIRAFQRITYLDEQSLRLMFLPFSIKLFGKKIDNNFSFLFKEKEAQKLYENWSHPAHGDQLVVNDSKFPMGQFIFNAIATVLPCARVSPCTQQQSCVFHPSPVLRLGMG